MQKFLKKHVIYSVLICSFNKWRQYEKHVKFCEIRIPPHRLAEILLLLISTLLLQLQQFSIQVPILKEISWAYLASLASAESSR